MSAVPERSMPHDRVRATLSPLAPRTGPRHWSRSGMSLASMAMMTALTATLLGTLPVTAAAAEATQLPLWELGLGAAALRLPHYRGSDQSQGYLLPVPYVVYRGQIFKADREGARAVLLDTQRLELDLSVSASQPTRSSDNNARAGMADLPPAFEIGPNAQWQLASGPGWKLGLRVPVRAVITVERHPSLAGWRSTPNLNIDFEGAAGWRLGLQGGPVLANRALHARLYEVSAADATPTRPAYKAAGGFGGMTAVAAASRRDGDRWTGLFVRWDSVQGARFADSPLVRQRNTWSAGIAMSWVLTRSGKLVDAQP